MKKIIIIGAGAMGSAFAVPCVENNNDVTIVGTHLEDNLIKDIISNDHLHPGLKTKLPKEIKFVQLNELQPLLEKDLDLIVAGISSVGIEWFAKQISKNYKKKLPIVLLTKGLSIVDNELTTLSDKIKNILEKNGHSEINISAIKGPCLAAGLANKMRTGTVIANQRFKRVSVIKKYDFN
jgi:glycerol-3-phosphate dehydrogenase (NAD(P)+)